MSIFAHQYPLLFARRPLAVLAAIVAVAALVGGFLAGMPDGAPVALAACGGAFTCGGSDPTATSALLVTHGRQGEQYVIPVEPEDGETWRIAATWSSDMGGDPGSDCVDVFGANVSATVTWADSVGWSVSCSGCSPYGPIRAVSVCNVGSCGENSDFDNGWTYKLLVDIDHTWSGWTCPALNPRDTYLSNVAYTTTSVDDGNLVYVPNCTEGTSVSPTSQTWSTADSGGFECGVSCNNNCPSIAIMYE